MYDFDYSWLKTQNFLRQILKILVTSSLKATKIIDQFSILRNYFRKSNSKLQKYFRNFHKMFSTLKTKVVNKRNLPSAIFQERTT